MTVYLGKRRVDIKHIGRAHTAGDAVIHVPDQNVMFTGDIVEDHSACYCGDGYFGDWGQTLDNIKAYDVDAIAPGRGGALIGKDAVERAIESTRNFVESTFKPAQRVAMKGGTLKEAWDAVRAECDPKFKDYAIYEHCLPFNVSRAFDEARALLTRGEQQLRGVHALELGKLLCKRGEVERLAGDLDAARAARDEAASIAAETKAGPDSELGRAVAALNDALNQ